MVPILLYCTLLAGQAMVAIRQPGHTTYTLYRYEETLGELLNGVRLKCVYPDLTNGGPYWMTVAQESMNLKPYAAPLAGIRALPVPYDDSRTVCMRKLQTASSHAH